MVIYFLDLLVYGFPHHLANFFFFPLQFTFEKTRSFIWQSFPIPCILPTASPSHHLTRSSTLCISCKLIVGTRAVVLNRDCTLESRGELLKKTLLSRPHPDQPNWDFWEWGPSRQFARGKSTALLEACSDSGSNFCPERFIESACSSGSPLQESPKT